MPTITVPAAALANAAGGTFSADAIYEPSPAAATATGPSPSLTGGASSITVSPAAAAASASSQPSSLVGDFLCGEYGAGLYGTGFYGICSVLSMSLFATTWDISYTTVV